MQHGPRPLLVHPDLKVGLPGPQDGRLELRLAFEPHLHRFRLQGAEEVLSHEQGLALPYLHKLDGEDIQ